jgi:hypothetical protein
LRTVKTAEKFIVEFTAIDAADKDVRFSEKEKTPYEMLVYQIGWMDLLKSWDDTERAGQAVITPSPDIKWNRLGDLVATFYVKYRDTEWEELKKCSSRECSQPLRGWSHFRSMSYLKSISAVGHRIRLRESVWKWIHINTVAPFTNFRFKTRKRKSQQASAE